MVKGVCLRYGKNEAEADDFLQDAFIKTFQKLDQFKGSGALGGWIRRIVVTTALEHIRKQKIVYSSLTTEMESLVKGSNDDSVFENIDLEILVSKIQKLPAGYRTVFNLYAVEGYSHKEIGEMIDISIGTSKSQYSRARKILIRELEQEEIEVEKKLSYVR